MKNTFLLLWGIALLAACSAPSSGKKDSGTPPMPETAALSHYGDSIEMTGAVPVTSLADKMETVDSLAIKLSGEITSTCSKKGCWMKMAIAPGKELRITFKDYGFFVPVKGVEGKTAVVEGYARKSVTDVTTLRHYAKDAGQSMEEINNITTPREEIIFVASGVIIKD